MACCPSLALAPIRLRKLFPVIVLLAIILAVVALTYTITDRRRLSRLQVSQPEYWATTEAGNKSETVKTVLLWTDFFGGRWADHFEKFNGPIVRVEANKSCFFTTDRQNLDVADALVFHGRDFKFEDLPERRYLWQRWIYYLLESPVYSGFKEADWRKFDRLKFNWSMTYSSDADVYAPYGEVRPQKVPPVNSSDWLAIEEKIAKFSSGFWKRKRDAIWLVSHCTSNSRREKVTRTLVENGIIVDSWGKCTFSKIDEVAQITGAESLFSQYRFYLSFENSLCDDYLSEKGFQSLYYSYLAGPIPIVYGGGNYSKIMPNGSYINAESFKTVSDLAKYMKKLSCPSNSDEVASHYNWLRDTNPRFDVGYEINPKTGFFIQDYYKRIIWSNLCRRLWKEDSRQGNYSSMVPIMRKRLGECHQPARGFADESPNQIMTFRYFQRIPLIY